MQRHAQVERCLATQGWQQRIGTFTLDDRRDDVVVERFDVGPIGERRIGHDRRRVGVHKDDPVSLFFQDPARLGSGVVELARLADNDGA